MPTTIQMFHVTATAAGQTVTFPQTMGTVMITNSGANPVWFAIGAVAPVAAFGNGRKRLITNESINLDNVDITQLSFRCAGALTTEVEMITQQAEGGGGVL